METFPILFATYWRLQLCIPDVAPHASGAAAEPFATLPIRPHPDRKARPAGFVVPAVRVLAQSLCVVSCHARVHGLLSTVTVVYTSFFCLACCRLTFRLNTCLTIGVHKLLVSRAELVGTLLPFAAPCLEEYQ